MVLGRRRLLGIGRWVLCDGCALGFVWAMVVGLVGAGWALGDGRVMADGWRLYAGYWVVGAGVG